MNELDSSSWQGYLLNKKTMKKLTKPEHPGVKEIMDIFYKTNPTLNWANKTYRASASYLIDKFGYSESIEMAQAAVDIQGRPYAPTVTNPWELKEKLLKVKLYFEREHNNKPKVAIIS